MNILNLRKDDFYIPVLKTLDALGGSGQIEEIDSKVIEMTGMTASDLEATYEKSGSLIVPDKISWARSYLKEGGLIINEGRGLWVLTEKGREKLTLGEQAVRDAVTEAMRIYNKNYNAAKATKKKSAPQEPSELVDAAANIELDEVGEWADQLLAKLQSMDPYAFERLSQRLLRKNGFVQVEVTKKSGDGGIDGKGVVRVNLVSFHVLFQCKRYQGSVGAGTVRDFRGAMQGRADKGLIITTGTFTPDARKEATRDGAPAIDLIDGAALCELLKDNRLGVSVEMVEQVTLIPEFFDEI
ncbi:MAG: restriction endonuclease [Sphingomonas sp.]|uniref:restriction endonuclease n=1 Tax=Sphingomonas sp. TaxID=28214 RepID=UPI0018371F79|nr:restriction endonuclease [Sphingomonas sp.]MBA3666898.1 restriction endonuclease [Sphingomonas sp.]